MQVGSSNYISIKELLLSTINVNPLGKMYFYDIVSTTNLPVFCMAFNSIKIPIDVSRYEKLKAHKIKMRILC